MATATPPPWQTDELAEEWPESPDPSSSNSHDSLLSPNGQKQQQQKLSDSTSSNPRDLEKMYGSIKWLGGGDGRKGTRGKDSGKGFGAGAGTSKSGGMRIVSGDVSFEAENPLRQVSSASNSSRKGTEDLPSPPSSGSESGKRHRGGNNNGTQQSSPLSSSTLSSAPAGTFLVRPTSPSNGDQENQSSAPAFLAKVRAAAAAGGGGGAGGGKGKAGGGMRGLGIFEPLAIEKMFDPPTPPAAVAVDGGGGSMKSVNGGHIDEMRMRLGNEVEEKNSIGEEEEEGDNSSDQIAADFLNRLNDQRVISTATNASSTGTTRTGITSGTSRSTVTAVTTASSGSGATIMPYGTLSKNKRSYPGRIEESPASSNDDGSFTPGSRNTTASGSPNQSGSSSNVQLRRTSHGYVPRRPSRLSESMTPPSPGHSSRSSTNGEGDSRGDISLPEQDLQRSEQPESSQSHQHQFKSAERRMRYFSGQRESMADMQFTFSPSPPPNQRHPHSALQRRPSVPDAATPFQASKSPPSADDPLPSNQQQRSHIPKLFQFKYNTVDGEGISELLESMSNTPVKALVERSAARRRQMGSGSGGVGSEASDRRISLLRRQHDWSRSRSRSGNGNGDEVDMQEGGSSPSSGSSNSGSRGSEESGFESGRSGEEDEMMMERNPKRIRLSEPLQEREDSLSGSGSRSGSGSGSDWDSSGREHRHESESPTPGSRHQPEIQPNPSFVSRPSNNTHAAGFTSSATSMAAAAAQCKLGHGKKGDRQSWGEKGEDLLRKIKQNVEVGSPSVSSVTESSAGMESEIVSEESPRREYEEYPYTDGPGQIDIPPSPPIRKRTMNMAPPLPQRAPALLSVPAQENAAPRVGSRPMSGTVNSANSAQTSTSRGGTSSGSGTITSQYMSNGRDIMDRIKQRKVSESSGTMTGGENGERPARVGMADKKGKGREFESDTFPTAPVQLLITEASVRPSSAASSRTNVSRLAPNTIDDVNQYISSASNKTNTVGTAVSTSFVKHRGPPSPPPPGGAKRITRLAPSQVPGLGAPQGRMIYDAKAMSWVKVSGAQDRLQQASTNEGSSSSGSEDVFAGLESLHDDQSQRNQEYAGEDGEIEELDGELRSVGAEDESGNDSNLSSARDGSSGSGSPASVAVLPAESESPSLMTINVSHVEIEDSSIHERLELPTPAKLQPERPLFKTVHSAPTPFENQGTPKSALKAAGAPGSALKKTVNIGSVTPGREESPSSALRRSVSFSEHRAEGKMRDAPGRARKRASTPAKSTVPEDIFDQSRGRDGADRSTAASARTRRIGRMLDGMNDDTVAADTPSRPSAHRHGRMLSESYATTAEDGTAETTIEGLSGFYARLRPSTSSGRNRADATFLTECSFAVAHDHLVEIITEVQPFEPYWEKLTKIDLSKRGATSVARLKEFLPKLDEANLNDNEISYLSGVPSSVRTLHVAGNKLTSVTAINHLLNLQYLDISRNDIDSVNPLSCLKHLRELKMDNNKIRDLSDIMSIDSLIKVSAVNNSLGRLDTSGANWPHLESLDVSQNRIVEVRGIEQLKSMHTLNLDNNRLDLFAVRKAMPILRILRLSHNRISQIDISSFPRLRTFYADGNRLSGLYRSIPEHASKIEHLSLRNQDASSLHLTYADLRDVKRLYISGNPLSSDFFPSRPLYSLIYLEAAACRLSSWPEDFSFLVPNIRALNINYNFISELSGLEGLQGLRKLSVVGAQLGLQGREGVMRSIRELANLEEVDLRMNPCTLGFYLPLVLPGGTVSSALDPSAATPNTPEGLWVKMDNTFRRSMPDVWYAKRLLYRGLVMASCEGIVRVDGIEVTSAERSKARSIAEMIV